MCLPFVSFNYRATPQWIMSFCRFTMTLLSKLVIIPIKNDIILAYHWSMKCILACHWFSLCIGPSLVICIVWRHFFIGTVKFFLLSLLSLLCNLSNCISISFLYSISLSVYLSLSVSFSYFKKFVIKILYAKTQM